MEIIILMLVTFVGYLVAYHTYGRFLARKVFGLRRDVSVPSEEFNDGLDYVPTKRAIIFGHHYTSIAGTGPIVGPAIGVIWGWVPALVWVFVGSILMGAVHDLGALVVSLRNQGKSIADITDNFMGPRVKWLFFVIVFLLLLIVIAIFGVIIAIVFARFPQSVFPVWMEIPIAVWLGYAVYRKSRNVLWSTALAVFLMYVTVVMGHWLTFTMPSIAFIPGGVDKALSLRELAGTRVTILPPTGAWTIILLVYAFVASTLPVTTLLQPRDYINAWQLFIAMGILVLGVLASGAWGGLQIVAPAVNLWPEGAPPIWPFLFITIACGAISGFHSLVASGTTSKQLAKETDAQAVGYGSMLMEGALATLVLIAVAAGIGMAYKTPEGAVLTGRAAWGHHYQSWMASKGLPNKITAVVIGSANMIGQMGIPRELGIIIIGVFIASFAGTTLDTATRIQRYVISEIFSALKLRFMTNRFVATGFAVATAAGLAFATGADGKGALTLWPLFGATNQMLASLALLVVTVYLKVKYPETKKLLYTGIPCLFMLVMTLWAMIYNEVNFCMARNWLLVSINGVTLLLSIWMAVEGIVLLFGRAGGEKRSAEEAVAGVS